MEEVKNKRTEEACTFGYGVNTYICYRINTKRREKHAQALNVGYFFTFLVCGVPIFHPPASLQEYMVSRHKIFCFY